MEAYLKKFKVLNVIVHYFFFASMKKYEFITNLADLFMSEPNDEIEKKEKEDVEYNPFVGQADHLRKIYRGAQPPPINAANKIYTHFDETEFVKINRYHVGLSDFVEYFNKHGIECTEETALKEVAKLYKAFFGVFSGNPNNQELKTYLDAFVITGSENATNSNELTSVINTDSASKLSIDLYANDKKTYGKDVGYYVPECAPDIQAKDRTLYINDTLSDTALYKIIAKNISRYHLFATKSLIPISISVGAGSSSICSNIPLN